MFFSSPVTAWPFREPCGLETAFNKLSFSQISPWEKERFVAGGVELTAMCCTR